MIDTNQNLPSTDIDNDLKKAAQKMENYDYLKAAQGDVPSKEQLSEMAQRGDIVTPASAKAGEEEKEAAWFLLRGAGCRGITQLVQEQKFQPFAL